MNQNRLKELMWMAGLDRKQLASLAGCHVKTTYWKKIPKHIEALVKQRIKLQRYEALRKALKEIQQDIDFELEECPA